MKRITIFVLLIALFAVASPAHGQACTPPAEAQATTVNTTGQYTAWAVGNVVTWCSTGGSVSSYESTYITILYFDGYWLPYNLYWGSPDGYLFQMNVSTGQGYLISPHGNPPGDEGGMGGNGAPQPQAEAMASNPTIEPTTTPAPIVRRPPVKPLVIRGFDILKLWQ